MNKIRYFFYRIFLLPPTLIGISIICFGICQFIPGGPVEQALLKMRGISSDGSISSSSSTLTEKHRKSLEKHFGFDKPIYLRYFNWIKGICKLDFGNSYKYPNKTVWQLIKQKFPISLIFGLTGFFLQYLICIPLGIFKAIYHNSKFDIGTSLIIFIGYAIPAFAFGMLLKMAFCGITEGLFDIFPLTGFVSENFNSLNFFNKISDILSHMTLPIICYIIGAFAILTVLMKNSLMEQISSDYIKTAIAKGNSFNQAVWKHGVRNSLIPIATGIGSFLTLLFAGSVLIEKVFEIPGMGLLSLDAIISRDYNVFLGIIIIQSFLALLGNIVSDFCYIIIDPRINFNKNY